MPKVFMELRMKSDLKTLISVKMLALVLEKISLRMSLFVEGVMLKSLACQSIAGWCLLCLAVISFQIMNRKCLSRFLFLVESNNIFVDLFVFGRLLLLTKGFSTNQQRA